jgi:hypothetical protein
VKRTKFRAELLDGHKGPAILVPFDPRELWGLAPVPVASETYGERPGHLVAGTLNGHAFEGWIGCRFGRHFLLVDDALRRAAKIEVGDVFEVALAPRGRSRATSAVKQRAARRER